jgi:hypothetical protein
MALAAASCATIVAFGGCVSLGDLTAEVTDASTTVDTGAAQDASSPTDALARPSDAADAADAANAAPTFHHVFVTSTTTKGNLGGIAGADQLCAEAATNGLLSGLYKAILSDPSGNARDHLVITLPVQTIAMGGVTTLVARDAMELWSGKLRSPINRDEKGRLVTQSSVWTGSGSDGRLPGTAHCTFWSSPLSSQSGWAGNLAATNQEWVISTWARRCTRRSAATNRATSTASSSRPQEEAGLDSLSDGQMWFDDMDMGSARSSGTGSSVPGASTRHRSRIPRVRRPRATTSGRSTKPRRRDGRMTRGPIRLAALFDLRSRISSRREKRAENPDDPSRASILRNRTLELGRSIVQTFNESTTRVSSQVSGDFG